MTNAMNPLGDDEDLELDDLQLGVDARGPAGVLESWEDPELVILHVGVDDRVVQDGVPIVPDPDLDPVAVVTQATPLEEVLCFPAGLIDRYGMFQGFRTDWCDWVARLLGPQDCGWFPRDTRLELSPALKQVVACTAFWDPVARSCWLYRRRGGEGRLHGMVSCLVGGHVNHADSRLTDDPMEAVYCAMRRENWEELGETDRARPADGSPISVKILGVVNDDSPIPGDGPVPVGACHFGVVYTCRRRSGSPLKVANLGGELIGWCGVLCALALDDLEPWSRHVLAYLSESGWDGSG